jgi:hypothetical protein
MKYRLFLIILLTGFPLTTTFAQTPEDSLVITIDNGVIKCYRTGYVLWEYNHFIDFFKDSPAALHEMKLAKANYNASKVLGYIGGFTLGYSVASVLVWGKTDFVWGIIAGAGIAGTGLSLYPAGKKRHIRAIHLYNASLKNTGYNNNGSLEFGITANGVGFIYRF